MATFFIVVDIPGQQSGERLQDHWSSDFFSNTPCIFTKYIQDRVIIRDLEADECFFSISFV